MNEKRFVRIRVIKWSLAATPLVVGIIVGLIFFRQVKQEVVVDEIDVVDDYSKYNLDYLNEKYRSLAKLINERKIVIDYELAKSKTNPDYNDEIVFDSMDQTLEELDDYLANYDGTAEKYGIDSEYTSDINTQIQEKIDYYLFLAEQIKYIYGEDDEE